MLLEKVLGFFVVVFGVGNVVGGYVVIVCMLEMFKLSVFKGGRDELKEL